MNSRRQVGRKTKILDNPLYSQSRFAWKNVSLTFRIHKPPLENKLLFSSVSLERLFDAEADFHKLTFCLNQPKAILMPG